MTKILDEAALATLEAVEKQATPGDWGYTDGDKGFDIVNKAMQNVLRPIVNWRCEDNANLICDARNHLPVLIDNVRRLKEALALAKSWLEDWEPNSVGVKHDMARIRELVGDE